MADNSDNGSSFVDTMKYLGGKMIKPITGAASVGAGYGAGHGMRYGLEEGLEKGLSGTLQKTANWAPAGGAVIGALLAPMLAEKMESSILSKPRVIKVNVKGHYAWVVTELPHYSKQPRIINDDGDVIVEGVRVARLEAVAQDKEAVIREDAKTDHFPASVRRDLENKKKKNKKTEK